MIFFNSALYSIFHVLSLITLYFRDLQLEAEIKFTLISEFRKKTLKMKIILLALNPVVHEKKMKKWSPIFT